MSNVEITFYTDNAGVDDEFIADEMNKVDGITAYTSYNGVSVMTDTHSAAFVEELFNKAVRVVMGICENGTAKVSRVYVDFDVHAKMCDVKSAVSLLNENGCRADYEYGVLRVRSDKLTQQDIVSLVGEKLEIV